MYLSNAEKCISFSAAYSSSVVLVQSATVSCCTLVSHVQEELLKNLREAIKEKDEVSFHHYLSGIDELLQDDNRMTELLDDSLAHAAYMGFQPAVETLIQKGAGKEYTQ